MMNENDMFTCTQEVMRQIKPFYQAYWDAWSPWLKVIEFELWIKMDFPADPDDNCIAYVSGKQFPGASKFEEYVNVDELMKLHNYDLGFVQKLYFIGMADTVDSFVIERFEEERGNCEDDVALDFVFDVFCNR